jgi:hypothetical protein
LADAEAVIRQWIQIMDEDNVSPSIRQSLSMLAITGTDLGDIAPPAMHRILGRMRAVQSRGLRDQVANRLGSATISELIFASGSVAARMLVATLLGWSQPLTLSNPAASSALIKQLKDAELSVLAETLATLQAHDQELWTRVVVELGDEDHMLDEIRRHCPWLLDLSVQPGDDGPVGFARLLHVSDDRQGNPRDRCVAFARLLLRLLPSIGKTDVEALLPGRLSLEIGGYVHGMSGLIRQYDHSETQIAWNQAQIATARAILGTPDSVRLSLAYPILKETAEFIREIGNRWVRSELTPGRLRTLNDVATRLERAASRITPSLGRHDIDPTVLSPGSEPKTTDPLSTLITNCASLPRRLHDDAGKPYLAAFVREHLLLYGRECLDEPWYLISEGDQAIEYLNQIISDCRDLATVLGLLQSLPEATPRIHDAARKVSAHHALHHCGREALQVRSASVDARRAGVAEAVAAVTGIPVEVLGEERDGLMHYAVLLPVPSLFRWNELQAGILDVLDQIKLAGEQFLILPLRDGRRIEGQGISLIMTPLPVVDVGEWKRLLPEPHDLTLEPLVSAALDNLIVMSGLTELTHAQLEHPDVESLGQQAGEAFTNALQQLSHQSGDLIPVLLGEIQQVVERLQEEGEQASQGPTFAAAFWLGVTGQPTPEVQLVQGMKLCAIEWEIDPAVVRETLSMQA